jgi:hypothetical protein
MKAQLSPISIAVQAALEKLGPAPESMDPRLLVLLQMHELHKQALQAAEFAEYAAHQAKLKALSCCEETKVRVEILKHELGMVFDNGGDETEEHA